MQLKPNTTTHTQQFQGTVKAFLFQCFKKKKKKNSIYPDEEYWMVTFQVQHSEEK